MKKEFVKKLKRFVENERRIHTRLRERAGEAKKSLVREVGGLLDMSTPMASAVHVLYEEYSYN